MATPNSSALGVLLWLSALLAGRSLEARTATETPGEQGKPSPKPSARLVIEDSVYDWGTAYKGELIQHTFTLTNEGGSPLLIKELKSDCGCTFARGGLENKTLAPAESTMVTVNIDTAELKLGLTKKYADIVVDADTEAEDTRLWLQGRIEELFTVHPEKPQLDVVRDEEVSRGAPLKLLLDSKLRKPAHIKKLASAKKLVSVKLTVLEPGRKYEVNLTPELDIHDNLKLHKGTLKAQVVVAGKTIDLSIPFRIVLRDRVEVTPARSVFFSREDTAQLEDRGSALPLKILQIKSIGSASHRFRITGVEVKSGAVKTRLETVKDGRLYRLHVELQRPTKARRVVKDSIRLTTDDPKVPEIKIPATALF